MTQSPAEAVPDTEPAAVAVITVTASATVTHADGTTDADELGASDEED